jgi:hypothetical protein
MSETTMLTDGDRRAIERLLEISERAQGVPAEAIR